MEQLTNPSAVLRIEKFIDTAKATDRNLAGDLRKFREQAGVTWEVFPFPEFQAFRQASNHGQLTNQKSAQWNSH